VNAISDGYHPEALGIMTKRRLYQAILLAFFALFMIYPLGFVLSQAFVLGNRFSLHFFGVMFRTELYRTTLCNSLNIALTVTLLCSLIAYPLALLFARYKFTFQGALHALLLAPLVVPPFVGVLGVRQLLSRFGSLNVLLLDAGIISSPVKWLGGGNVIGIIALQVIHLTPVLYLSIRASLENSHISLEEAAVMSGASRWRVLRRIILPLSTPGWFAGATLVFIASFTDLGTPLIFEYRRVLSVQIYNMLSDLQENPVGYSFVVSTCVLSIALFILSQASILSGSFSGSGRAREGRMTRKLSPLWRTLAPMIATLYVACACIPQIAVLLVALSKDWFMSVLPQRWTLGHFAEVLQHQLTARSLVISICLSCAASLLTILVGFLTAQIICRGKGRMRLIFEALTLVPLAIPGIVFAFGFIGAFSGSILDNRLNPFPLLIIAYTIRRLPAMVRSVTAGLQEANRALEEAGLMVGASPFTVTRRITFPLIRRHLIVGALLTFAYSMIEVSDSLLLALEAKFYPISKAIYAMMGRPDGLEVASALGVLVMVLMLITFYLSERVSRGRGLGREISMILLAVSFYARYTYGQVQQRSEISAPVDEIVVLTPHWDGIRFEFSNGFAKYWKERTGRDVTMRWLDIGGTSDIVKYINGQFKQTPNGIDIDLFFGGGADSFVELEHKGLLAPVNVAPEILDAIPQNISGVPLYSLNKVWFANAISAFGLLYNKVAIDRLGLPKPRSWIDLSKPEYFGLVGAGDPRKSGSMHAMFEIILQGYGWDKGWQILQKIARNVNNFTGTASQIGKDVATGEIIYGIAIDTYAGDIIRQVGADRLEYHLPDDFAAINGDCIAMLKGAPHSEAASAFIEFILSKEGQLLWYAKKGAPGGPVRSNLGKLSVIPSLYGTVEPATIFQGNPFTLPNILAYDAEKAGKRWNLFNDIFGTFLIDLHGQLVRVTDPATLRGIPISEPQALRLVESGSWGSDAALRTDYLKAWAESGARDIPVSDTLWDRLLIVPGVIFGALLVVLGLRRAFGA
jgi:iron(III) transport system permease protein